VTAKFAAVHKSANTAAGTAVNAARWGPLTNTHTPTQQSEPKVEGQILDVREKDVAIAKAGRG
jgi:hypothetical protein